MPFDYFHEEVEFYKRIIVVPSRGSSKERILENYNDYSQVSFIMDSSCTIFVSHERHDLISINNNLQSNDIAIEGSVHKARGLNFTDHSNLENVLNVSRNQGNLYMMDIKRKVANFMLSIGCK